MVKDEKLKKVCDDFSSLNDEQQDYILGILQALAFANSTYSKSQSDSSKTAPKKNR